MIVGLGSWSKKIDVPFNSYPAHGKVINHFNVSELLKEDNKSCENINHIRSYIMNFDIFTRTFDFINQIG